MEHEYSVLGGLNRAVIGRYLSMVSAIAASGIGVFVLWAVDLAKRLGVADHIPGLVLWPVTASLIYAGLYWLFDKRVWKIGVIADLLKVPDLAGKWHCDGQTINPDKTLGYKWEGEVTIVQSWDKLRVRLKTAQSASNSIAAALVYDQADGFRLLYNYKNEPRIGEAELVAHRGAAELTFSADLTAAEGEYFNGHGRFTFGNMKLTRKD
ncbi:Cap15 family cyclic dinucleotide receptor domain-containing protein [Burkholderia ubonensis]|uniref:Cap15 family cyclic dinucleotide receptor domain-containing protein n=1 Tax=Burkholderia ubonensis TaxID=101571 RepID=UPI002ABDC513|nr:hypothetical protein [Burkholderia ubonensis]